MRVYILHSTSSYLAHNIMCTHVLTLVSCPDYVPVQSLCQQSKTRIYIADPGSASDATPVHNIFCRFIPLFSTSTVRSSFTSKNLNKDQKTEQVFFCLFVQVLQSGDIHELCGGRFCAGNPQALVKVTSTRSGFPWIDSRDSSTIL